MTLRIIAAAALLSVASIAPAGAAEIEGVWKTESGEEAQLYACGPKFCIKILTGKHKGTVIADDLSGNGSGTYSGSLLNPADGKTYAGHASLKGAALKLQGCALKIFCKTQTWARVR